VYAKNYSCILNPRKKYSNCLHENLENQEFFHGGWVLAKNYFPRAESSAKIIFYKLSVFPASRELAKKLNFFYFQTFINKLKFIIFPKSIL
jgi:hypothetical protein